VLKGSKAAPQAKEASTVAVAWVLLVYRQSTRHFCALWFPELRPETFIRSLAYAQDWIAGEERWSCHIIA